MTTHQYKYYILYGFLEGQRHGALLSAMLEQEGFVPANSAAEADILIAHSAGCWEAPVRTNAQLLVLIGMPLANQHAFADFAKATWLNCREFAHNKQLRQWGKSVATGIGHSLQNPLQHIRRANGTIHRRLNAPLFTAHKVLFLANHHDPWPRTAMLSECLNSRNFSFISLPGSHDNLWLQPEPYVKIIKCYAK